MAQRLDAGVREHPREPLGVVGQELAGDQELAARAGGRAQPRLEGEVDALADGADADEEDGQAGPALARPRGRVEARVVIAVAMAREVVTIEALVDERLEDEVRRAQQPVGERVLLLLQAQRVGVVGVLVVGGQRDAEALALGAHGLVGEARMRVGALEDAGDPQPACGAQRLAGAHGPRVDDVDLVLQARQRARHQAVVQLQGAGPAERLVGDPHLAARERRAYAHLGGQRPVHGAGHHEDVGAGRGRAGRLMPCRGADPRRADLVRKALQDPDRAGLATHEPRAPRKPTTSARASSASPATVRGSSRGPNHASSSDCTPGA